MLRTGTQTTPTKRAISHYDGRQFFGRRVRSFHRRRSPREIHFHGKTFRTSSLWIQDFQCYLIENVHLRERILGNFFCFQGIRTNFLGNPKTGDYTLRQQIRHTIL